MDENWKVLSSLFPLGWKQMAQRCGATERLRGFRSSEVLLRMILLHVGKGYSLRETTVQARLAKWADISDVALFKRLRKSEEWLRSLCVGLLKENNISPIKQTSLTAIRLVDGTNSSHRIGKGSTSVVPHALAGRIGIQAAEIDRPIGTFT